MSSSQIGRDAFKKRRIFETSISNYHGIIMTVMKSRFPRLKPKVIRYRCYKKFDAKNSLSDVKLAKFDVVDDPEQAYDNLACTFRKLVDKHAPLKTKSVTGK